MLCESKENKKNKKTIGRVLPHCTKRHHRNEYPLNAIEVCFVCEENNSIDKFPSWFEGYLPRNIREHGVVVLRQLEKV